MIKKKEKQKKFRKALYILTLTLMAIALIFKSREKILGQLGDWLVRDDSVDWSPGDYVVVLMGDLTSSRAYAAYETWRKDPRQTIIVMEENKFGFYKFGFMPAPSSAHQKYFEFRGIPSEKIKVIDDCAVDSTLDEAQCFFNYLEKNHLSPKSLTLVTSFYHSSRAYWIFSHIFHKIGKKNVKLSMLPAQALDLNKNETNPSAAPKFVPNHLWWQREDLFIAVFNEYLKWTYWQIKGLPPTMVEAVETTSNDRLHPS